jgi:aminodeoxyfutalosine deaminase
MTLRSFIKKMPKVEMHVHLEGSIQPETLLHMAERNSVALPANTVEGLRTWYTFTDFPHFVDIYLTISSCICSGDDIEYVAREFLREQASQNIRYSEVIFTPYTHFSLNKKIPFDEQIAALASARSWAKEELGIGVGWVLDFARNLPPVEHAVTVAEWAVGAMDSGVVGLGIGGYETGFPPELFKDAFKIAKEAGLASQPHAGEIGGPESVWGAVDVLNATRIGHGVRCLEDPKLVEYLRDRQIPLDVSPTSNVCLGVVPSFAEHPLPKLMAEGLYVTLNSDDPPMFNTTLTDEYLNVVEHFGFDQEAVENLVLAGVGASVLPAETKVAMDKEFRYAFASLKNENS